MLNPGFPVGMKFASTVKEFFPLRDLFRSSQAGTETFPDTAVPAVVDLRVAPADTGTTSLLWLLSCTDAPSERSLAAVYDSCFSDFAESTGMIV